LEIIQKRGGEGEDELISEWERVNGGVENGEIMKSVYFFCNNIYSNSKFIHLSKY